MTSTRRPSGDVDGGRGPTVARRVAGPAALPRRHVDFASMPVSIVSPPRAGAPPPLRRICSTEGGEDAVRLDFRARRRSPRADRTQLDLAPGDGAARRSARPWSSTSTASSPMPPAASTSWNAGRRDWDAFFEACGDDPVIEEIARLLELLDSLARRDPADRAAPAGAAPDAGLAASATACAGTSSSCARGGTTRR